MKKNWLIFLILMSVLFVLPHAATAAGEPTVKILLDKESVEVGEPVSVEYEITGPFEYHNISWSVYAWTTESEGQGTVESAELEGLKGNFTCVPRFGVAMTVAINFEDEMGRHYCYESDKIKVTGYSVAEPNVIITFDKEDVEIGETVEIEYEINGPVEYKNITWETYAWTTESNGQGPVESAELEGLKGNFTCVPRFGVAMTVAINFEDEMGRHYYYESDKVKVTGYSVAEPNVIITFDKEDAEIGETVEIEYEINGPVEYQNITWETYAWTTESNGQGPVESGKLETLKGSFSCKPRFGIAMTACVTLEDETGRRYRSESKKIVVEGYASEYANYSVTEGQNAQIFTGENSLTFCTDGEFEKYLGVQVDGKSVPDKYVEVWSGSTYVKLNADYLASLAEGEHELIIIFEDGVAVTKFATAAKLPELPKTGDPSDFVRYILLLVFSTVSIGIMVRRHRTE